ncbi:aminotransferase, partial [Streptomyces sp. A475]
GWDAARTHMSALADYAQQYIAERWGVSLDGLPPEPAPAMRLVPLPDAVATDQAAAHALQHAIADRHACATSVTTWRGRGFLRLSAHLYNTPTDYQDFADRCDVLHP